MSSVNKAILIGRLGRDPEIKATQSGGKIASFSIATSEQWKDKAGEKQERTEWHNVVIFNEGLAKLAETYLRKGSQVYLEGSLRTRKWEKDGVDRYTTEIVLSNFDGVMRFLGKPAEGGASESAEPKAKATAKPKAPAEPDPALDDDVPF